MSGTTRPQSRQMRPFLTSDELERIVERLGRVEDGGRSLLRLLTLAAAGERLAVSPRTIDRYLRNGDLPTVRLPGGHRRVDVRDIDALIASRTVPGREVSR